MADLQPTNNKLLTGLVCALTVAVAAQSYFLYRLNTNVNATRVTENGNTPMLLSRSSASPGAGQAPHQAATSLLPAPTRHMDPLSLFDDNWDPFQELQHMRDQMGSMFDDSFSHFRMNSNVTNLWGDMAFSPSLDMKEEKDRYVVRMDIPGADKSNLNVSVDDRLLTVSGQIDEQRESHDGDQVLHRERRSGQFQRSVSLPGPVKASGLDAQYENGVLTVTVPKADTGSESKHIQIK